MMGNFRPNNEPIIRFITLGKLLIPFYNSTIIKVFMTLQWLAAVTGTCTWTIVLKLSTIWNVSTEWVAGYMRGGILQGKFFMHPCVMNQLELSQSSCTVPFNWSKILHISTVHCNYWNWQQGMQERNQVAWVFSLLKLSTSHFSIIPTNFNRKIEENDLRQD